jgi:hypothetical protein
VAWLSVVANERAGHHNRAHNLVAKTFAGQHVRENASGKRYKQRGRRVASERWATALRSGKSVPRTTSREPVECHPTDRPSSSAQTSTLSYSCSGSSSTRPNFVETLALAIDGLRLLVRKGIQDKYWCCYQHAENGPFLQVSPSL